MYEGGAVCSKSVHGGAHNGGKQCAVPRGAVRARAGARTAA
jgi:hypothetical protein